MDDILEIVFKGIKEVIKFIVYVVILNIIIFNIGRFTLLAVTLGKYPRFKHLEKDAEKIMWFGLFVIVAAWSVLAIYNNLGNT